MAYGNPDQIEEKHFLFVASGVQRGASVSLSNTPLVLGADRDADVMLLDDEVGEASAVLTADQSGRLTLTSNADRVVVNRRTLRKGQSCAITRRTPFTLGSVKLVVAQSLNDADRVLGDRKRTVSNFGKAAGIVAAIGLASGIGALSAKNDVETKSYRVTVVGKDHDNLMAPQMIAARALEDELKRKNLATLEVGSDRRSRIVVVSGPLRDADRNTWIGVQQWFDAEFADTVQLDTEITPAREHVTLPFRVEAIWMSPSPRLTLHDGSRSMIGDLLPGGWKIESISPDNVEISRSGEVLVLSL